MQHTDSTKAEAHTESHTQSAHLGIGFGNLDLLSMSADSIRLQVQSPEGQTTTATIYRPSASTAHIKGFCATKTETRADSTQSVEVAQLTTQEEKSEIFPTSVQNTASRKTFWQRIKEQARSFAYTLFRWVGIAFLLVLLLCLARSVFRWTINNPTKAISTIRKAAQLLRATTTKCVNALRLLAKSARTIAANAGKMLRKLLRE